MTKVKVFAPAKINLALHITGQREDGYHLIDSLVAFANIGDTLFVENNGTGVISSLGSEAPDLPTGPENLIARQNMVIAHHVGLLNCTLHKELPVSSGIGGGSADAAALYRAGVALANAEDAAQMTREAAIADQWRLGADIPMCIKSEPARVSGIGEHVNVIDTLPDMPLLLVNPRTPVPTAAVFSNLSQKNNGALITPLPARAERGKWILWLQRQRNDLQPPAIAQVPVISEVLQVIEAVPRCLLARMSGSGATCFGLFETDSDAKAAEAQITRQQPGWWVRAGRLDGHRMAAPQVIRSTT